MSCRHYAIVPAIILSSILWSCPSIAEGALAIGLASDVAKHGFASGHKANAPDFAHARQEAIDGCHRSIGASEEAKK